MGMFDILKDPKPGGNLLGQSYDQWFDKLGVDEGAIESMMARMLANVGTTQRQSFNIASETAAAGDVPLATEIAMKRGGELKAQRAVTQGTTDIQGYADTANRQAWQTILGADLQERGQDIQKQLAEAQMNSDFWGTVLGGIGQYGALSLLI